MTKIYQDTNTNAEQKIDNWIMLWSFLFGGFYFMFKGMWFWVLVFFLIMILSSADPILPFFAAGVFALFSPRLVEQHYIKKGWKLKDA